MHFVKKNQNKLTLFLNQLIKVETFVAIFAKY